MADRFSGDVMIGGKISKSVFSRIEDLLLPLLEGDLEDGCGIFTECAYGDFDGVRLYCVKHNIALAIYWDAKWEYNAVVEFHVGGRSCEFITNSNGQVVVSVDELESNKHLSIPDFIASLEIPEFPELEVVDE